MCFSSGKSSAPPPPPPVAPEPTREEVKAQEALDKVATTTENKVRTKKQQGVYNNIHTTAQGDPQYGIATFGKPVVGNTAFGAV